MKKILSFLLVLIMILALVACSKEKNGTSDTVQDTTKSQEAEKDTESPDAEETEDTTEESLTEESSEEDTPTETPKQESTSTNTNANTTVNKIDSIQNAAKNFSPKVLASRCSHNYRTPTCTSLIPCTICGELLTGLYQGQQIPYGHYYVDNKCNLCGYERTAMLEFNGSFFAVNQPIVVDILFQTSDKDVEIYPCVTLYKNVNGSWRPYSGMTSAGEFFALEAAYGETLSSGGVKYGRWDYMSNSALKTNPNALVEQDFSSPRLIRRFKISFPEAGEYKIDISNGPNNSKKVAGKNYQFIINTY